MRTARSLLVLFFHCFLFFSLSAQPLKPGFDKQEYLQLLQSYSRWGDSVFFHGIPAPDRFQMVYRSPTVGLENRWELEINNDHSQAVVSIRGTTAATISWMANFYAAMVPAKGVLHLSATHDFAYHLSDDSLAAVHVGWLVALAYMSDDIVSRIDSCYKAGIKDVIVFGHSQGGAIAYLLTSYLLDRQKTGKIPADIRFKTICSAGPKPGNIFYAYSYEQSRAGGWGYNVVNPSDWVPIVPVSIQTLSDFPATNPFIGLRKIIKKQSFFKRIVFSHLYNQLDKHNRKAQRKYEKYLGRMISKYVVKHLKSFTPPEYIHSDAYERAGVYIILKPDEPYHEAFPDHQQDIFTHHKLQAYYRLALQLDDR